LEKSKTYFVVSPSYSIPSPAFAPPTWMALSYVGFKYPLQNVILLGLVGAMAATLGRLTLAKLSRAIIRRKFLSQTTRDNIDAIREGLEYRHTLTFGVFLLYAFSPYLPTICSSPNGLTSLGWRLIAIPFFIGRVVGYGFWALAGSTAARKIAFESSEAQSYLGVYFVASQILLLSVIYLFTKIDWRVLFRQKKLKWMASIRERGVS